jgi:hypothetical protein
MGAVCRVRRSIVPIAASAHRLSTIALALASFWRHGRRVERVAYSTAVLLLLSGVVHGTLLVVSGGSWEGPLSMRKPTAFGLSFGLTLMTIAWVSSFLDLRPRVRALLVGTFTAASVLETALISLQYWRGVPSHFNEETSFDAVVMRLLAFGGGALVIVIVTLALAAHRRQPGIPASLALAIRLGLGALVASLAVGGMMIGRGMTLLQAGDAQAAYATAGALKATHAATMHGVLVLPLLAWALSFADWPEPRRVGTIARAGGSYLLLAATIAVANFQGASATNGTLAVAGIALGAFIAAGLSAAAGIARSFTGEGLAHRLAS